MSHVFFDLKLHVFRLLKYFPNSSVQKMFKRKYYGRLRAYNKTDLDAVFSRLPDRPTIVDFGANDRPFLPEILLEKAGEFHAVEPDPLVFEILRANTISHNNVRIYNAAIDSDDGEITLYRQSGFEAHDPVKNSVGSSIFADHASVNPTLAITVQKIGILTFLNMIGKHVDLMKMDIEGAEVQVLETLLSSPLQKTVSYILVETHEHVLPELVNRTDDLRRRAKKLNRPKIDMNWM